MKRLKNVVFTVVLGMVCLSLFSAQVSAQTSPKGLPQGKHLALASFSPAGITWVPQIQYESIALTVSGQGSVVFHEEFEVGATPSMGLLDQDGNPLMDGQYRYELRFAPVIASNVRQDLAAVQESEDRSLYVAELRSLGMLPREALVQSGTFRVLEGKIILPNGVEDKHVAPRTPQSSSISKGSAAIPKALDQVTADDLIVTGSACVGFDCLTDGTETFGFDTIKLKENNLRIYFDDTSATAGFPANDWRIIVNDSASGGANYFAVEDSTGAKTPFRIEAGAPSNSLYVEDYGRIGLKTSTPAVELHIVDGDTPTVRLDQDTSSGWTAQVWDVAGNESNFFIRDTTGGSKLPFRIQPGTPTNTLALKSDGKVGIGTWSPAHDLDVILKTTSLVRLANTESDATTKAARMVVRHYNNAQLPVYLFGAASTLTSNFVAFGGGYASANAATQIDLFTAADPTTPVGSPRLTIKGDGNIGMGTQTPSYPLQMASGAHVTAGGVWTNASSRDYKKEIKELSGSAAMKTLEGLNPVTFKYKTAQDEQHVGFIAEDVPDLVASKDRKGLSPMDIVAVLTKVVQEQRKEIEEQRKEYQKTISVLSERMAELERVLQLKGTLATVK